MNALVPLALLAAAAAGVYAYEQSKAPDKKPEPTPPGFKLPPKVDPITFQLPPDFQLNPGAQTLQFTAGQTMKPADRQRAARLLAKENMRRALVHASRQRGAR